MCPIYEYSHSRNHRKNPCPLGHEFEWLQRFEDDPLETCPECGRKIIRLISGTNIKISDPGLDHVATKERFEKYAFGDEMTYSNQERWRRAVKARDEGTINDHQFKEATKGLENKKKPREV